MQLSRHEIKRNNVIEHSTIFISLNYQVTAALGFHIYLKFYEPEDLALRLSKNFFMSIIFWYN